MKSCKYTAFGLCVKTELLKIGREQQWLQEAVKADTGLRTLDSGYMYKILTGSRHPQRVISSICKILKIQMLPEFIERKQHESTENIHLQQ